MISWNGDLYMQSSNKSHSLLKEQNINQCNFSTHLHEGNPFCNGQLGLGQQLQIVIIQINGSKIRDMNFPQKKNQRHESESGQEEQMVTVVTDS